MTRKLIITLLATAGFLGGCQNKMHDENLQLHAQNRELQARVDDLQVQLDKAPDPNSVAMLQSQISAKDARISDLQAKLNAAPKPEPKRARPTLAGVDSEYDEATGTLTVTIGNDVLFDSGEAKLKNPRALDTLISAIKRQYPGKRIRVEGHTDSDPLVRTKAKWGDNLGLSMARAASVTRYFTSKGINAKLITTSGYGEHHPKSRDKKANRRVEVVVIVR